ncbi:ABC transporter permease [Agrobacterium tumefaciens]|uniref:ABC transporter permease n=1 Tax=Agrobacterium tumefaciens TaxID=358 RepID=UPI0015733EF9|nr:ABC transporter permease [Agrobacterium tumefaciens]NTE68258.1 ABC transporter permease [Agrobacterium tumefaciens]
MMEKVTETAATKRKNTKHRSVPFSVVAGALWIAFIVFLALLANQIAPYQYTALDLPNRLASPFHPRHLLGTDELGRDVLSRLIFSVRISVLVALGATLISACFGTTMGFVAAHFRGRVEQFILMLADFQAAMPFLILSLSVLAFFGNTLPLFIGLMGLYGWERYARISRGLAISASAQGYAGAVRQLGASPTRIYLRHILPNISSTLIVSMTLTFPEIILMESSLSFLGLGVQPPMTSLGNMVGYAREYMTRAPWIMFAPAALIVTTTLSISLLGDWLRDRVDKGPQ